MVSELSGTFRGVPYGAGDICVAVRGWGNTGFATSILSLDDLGTDYYVMCGGYGGENCQVRWFL